MQAIEVLSREHSDVLAVAEAASRQLGRQVASLPDVTRYAGDLVSFFRDAGRCHDAKEDRLFAAVLHRRVTTGGHHPVAGLLGEREALRLALESASDWLALAAAGNAAALQPLVYDLRLYLDLLRRHIAAEECTLFPLAARALTGAESRALARCFDGWGRVAAPARLRDRHLGVSGAPAASEGAGRAPRSA